MRLLLCIFVLSTGAFADSQPASSPEEAALRRAELDLQRVENLVATGVLPRARLDQAKAVVEDARDDAAIRKSLFEKDISVDEAKTLAELTQKRVERHKKVVDDRNQLLEQGIIAKSELADEEAMLERARQEHDWAVKRLALAEELADLAKNEQELMRQMEAQKATGPIVGVERFTGAGHFEMTQFPAIEQAFERKFARPMPISAMGETEVHRALGFDHRNRVDIALTPDQPEGRWLRQYLTTHNIPYFAFRTAVAHKATGAHIHIGPASGHYIAQAHTPGSSGRAGGE